jgi:protein-S-isoprenylcysteine O-methyltransferase
LSFAGLALFLSSWIVALVILVPIAAAFIRRIAIEEKVLGAAFPGEYADYARHTSRLVPLVY